MIYIFVYGSLRKGLPNYLSYMRDARLTAEHAWTLGSLYDTGAGYPGLIPGNEKIVGEIYQITEERLVKIDELEDYFGPGHPENLYDRILTKIQTPKGVVTAWIYYYRDEERLKQLGLHVPSGDWKKYMRDR